MSVARDNPVLQMMYRGTVTPADLAWDSMTTVPILYLMTPQDIQTIKNLILSPRYSGNNRIKTEKIDEIMHFRGFTKFAGGTNRLVYTHPAAPNAVFKVAIDSVGINDNPAEFRNQNLLKPYCCKVFECSPCGTIASFEKVDRITTFDEFFSINEDYFDIITNHILGKYVMDDIGTNYFMNFGIRRGYYPVILDYPYLFELDGDKIECMSHLDDGSICHGEIDYDDGFNKLVCTRCGRTYMARDLAKPPKEGGALIRKTGGRRMRLEILRGDKVIKTYDTTVERDFLSRNDPDVVNKKAADAPKQFTGIHVVLERVPVKAPKEEPVHRNNVVHHQTIQPIASHKEVKQVPEQKVVRTTRYIDVSLNKSKTPEEPKIVATAGPKQIGVVLERTPIATEHKPVVKKPEIKKAEPVVDHKVETVKEQPVAERIINVSINPYLLKKKTEDINTEGTDPDSHSIKVILNRMKDELPKKEEDEKVVEVKFDYSEKKEEPKEETPVEEAPKVEEPEPVVVKEEKPVEEAAPETKSNSHLTDDEIATKMNEAFQRILKENEGRPMQQAIFFEDEAPVQPEEVIKEPVEEKEETKEPDSIPEPEVAEEKEEEIVANNKPEEVTADILDDPEDKEPDTEEEDGDVIIPIFWKPGEKELDEFEEGIFYCLPRHGWVKVEELSKIKDASLIDRDQYEIFAKAEDEIVPIYFDQDEDCWIEDDMNPEKLSILKKEGFTYELCGTLPDPKEAKDDMTYIVAGDDDLYDVFVYHEELEKYCFLFKMIDDTEDEEVDTSSKVESAKSEEAAAPDKSDLDELVEQIKATSKKLNPEDLLK